MKSTQLLTRSRMGRVNKSRRAGRIQFTDSDTPLFPERLEHRMIQWPSDHQIQEVSRRLARISRQGIRWEAHGDYFNSGDLAYQLQEIIRTTDELFKKCRRLRK